MPTVLQFRRGTTTQNNNFTGSLGEISIDTTLDTFRIHDGSTAGGFTITQNAATQTLTNKTLTSPILTTPTVTTAITLNAQADLRFADSDSSNYVAFQAPTTVSSNVIWTLPNADATTSGYALTSNASGTLSWAAAGATVTQDNSTNTAFHLYYATTTSGALTALKYDGADMTFNPSTSTLVCTNITGTSSAAKYADLAEMYAADESYEPGTVLVLGGESEVTSCKEKGNPRVLGIVSSNPAYLMNSALDTEHVVPVALIGRVFAKVTGKIFKGDLMVTSEVDGYAESWHDSSSPPPGSILGKAVEDKANITKGIIEILVGSS